MKLTALILTTVLISATSAATWAAADCTSSFYCYGNTGKSVTSVATRPPPIPPPNPRVTQQRRQQQLALRANTNPANRAAARPAPPVAQRPAPAPQPRANLRPAPAPRPANTVASCAVLNDKAASLESQAVIASKRGDRKNSVQLFKAAANLRKQACR